MDVFVAGGTGVVGRPALRAMVGQGHHVRVAVRSSASARLASQSGATPVEVDLFDRDAVLTAARGADAVVNLATSIPPTSRAWRRSAWRPNDRLRREASVVLAEAALAHEARFVQESFALALPSRPGEVIGEETRPTPSARAATILDAEATVDRVRSQGGIGILLRFAWFHGRGVPQAEEALGHARRGLLFLPGSPDARFPIVDAGDAGRAVAAALDAPAGTYHVVDDEPLSRVAHRDVLRGLLGRNVHLPPAAAARGPAEILSRDQLLSNAKLRAATGWAPLVPSAREGWAAMVEAAR